MPAFEDLWGTASYTHNEKFCWKIYTFDYNTQSWGSLLVVRPLKTERNHDAGHTATDDTVGCRGDNPRCHQPRQSQHHQCYQDISYMWNSITDILFRFQISMFAITSLQIQYLNLDPRCTAYRVSTQITCVWWIENNHMILKGFSGYLERRQLHFSGIPLLQDKSHNAPISYPTIQYIAAEMCTFLFQSSVLWDMRQMGRGLCEIGRLVRYAMCCRTECIECKRFQAPVPLTIFRSNSKFDENLERSS